MSVILVKLSTDSESVYHIIEQHIIHTSINELCVWLMTVHVPRT